MKKLLVLALVLSMASLASAALQLEAVDYQGQMLLPSDTVVLSIRTLDLIAPQVGEGYWALAAPVAGGTISGGASLITTESGIAIFDDAVTAGVPLPEGDNGVFGIIALGTIPSVAAGTLVYDGIIFHCEGPGDVLVTLYYSPDAAEWSTVNSMVIHQIPEPMTLGLLGLGGLFLRRKK